MKYQKDNGKNNVSSTHPHSRLHLLWPWDAAQFLTEIFNLFLAVPEQKQSKPAEVLKIDIRFDKR